MKGFALRLVLKQRHKRTRKWPICPLWKFECEHRRQDKNLSRQNLSFDFVETIPVLSASADRPLLFYHECSTWCKEKWNMENVTIMSVSVWWQIMDGRLSKYIILCYIKYTICFIFHTPFRAVFQSLKFSVNMSNTRDRILPQIQTPRKELKIWCAAKGFWWTLRCLGIW